MLFMAMALIYQTPNFTIESAEPPHIYVSREEGDHIRIKPKVAVSDRTKLSGPLRYRAYEAFNGAW